MSTEDLTITSGDIAITGWTDIRVTRGIERLPSDFSIGLTELYPDEFSKIDIEPGAACEVRLGDDPVVTGYIDHFLPSIGPSDHSMRITGRSKCSDLVDCAAEYDGGQISNASVLGVAQKLASVYGPRVNGVAEGIAVATSVADLPILPQTNIMLGESAFEIIDRMARFSAVLAYDLPDGSLLLSQVGTRQLGAGVAEGVNVQRAYIDYSADLNYSNYDVYLQSTDLFMDAGNTGNFKFTATDVNSKRHRRMVIICESASMGIDIAEKRAVWERSRRFGRSRVVKVVVDGWRDQDGKLWEPNTLIPVSLPRLKLPSALLLLSEVTFQRNDNAGTTAELTLMAPEAFSPQPINLTPLWGDVPQVY
ncbi:phage baseplate assembly protein [Pseudomonas bohemica]|uniref:phage baseplate assembly protein n=1 Tax=Pseudomonas bohemica TaxID=2044872 RepID=UPI000DA6178F|nr:hypothetical protein [Pseudomonas bohemica]